MILDLWSKQDDQADDADSSSSSSSTPASFCSWGFSSDSQDDHESYDSALFCSVTSTSSQDSSSLVDALVDDEKDASSSQSSLPVVVVAKIEPNILVPAVVVVDDEDSSSSSSAHTISEEDDDEDSVDVYRMDLWYNKAKLDYVRSHLVACDKRLDHLFQFMEYTKGVHAAYPLLFDTNALLTQHRARVSRAILRRQKMKTEYKKVTRCPLKPKHPYSRYLSFCSAVKHLVEKRSQPFDRS